MEVALESDRPSAGLIDVPAVPPTGGGVPRRALAAITSVAALVAIAFLGRRSILLDEAVSVGIATSSWSSFVEAVTTREVNMALYYLLLRGWVVVTGHGETAVRALSVIFGVITVPVLALVGFRLLGRRAGVLAGLLLAVNVAWLEFAQQARGYSLCLLLVTVATWLFVRGIEHPRPATWVAYGVVGALAAYAHFFAVLVLAAHAFSLVVLPWRRVPWRSLLIAGPVLAVGLAPLAIHLLSASSDGIAWASSAGGGSLVERMQAALPTPAGAVLAIVVVSAAAVAVRRLRRHLPTDEPLRWWRFAVPLSWLFVPLVLAGAFSYFATPVLVPRYFLIIVPPLVLLIAHAVATAPRPARGVALVVIGTVSILSVTRFYGQDAAEDWRAATAHVSGESVPGDAVVVYAPFRRIPFEYYLERFPAVRSQLVPVFPAFAWGRPTLDLVRPVAFSADRIEQGLDGHDRLWLVVGDSDAHDPQLANLQRTVEQRFEIEAERHFTGVTVLRYEAP